MRSSKPLPTEGKHEPLPSEWACQGATNIRIIGDGRIYTPEALAAAIINAGF